MPIVSGNSAVHNVVVAGNDENFSERVLLTFFIDGSEDETRPAREIHAPLIVGSRHNVSLAGNKSDKFATDVRVGGARLLPSKVTYPDLDIRQGDIVTALNLIGEPNWRVSSVDERLPGRFVIHLGDFS